MEDKRVAKLEEARKGDKGRKGKWEEQKQKQKEIELEQKQLKKAEEAEEVNKYYPL